MKLSNHFTLCRPLFHLSSILPSIRVFSSESALCIHCSVTELCPTVCDHMDRQSSLSFTNSRSLLKLMSIESVMPSNQFILCHPLLLLPSIFLSIRVFSNELALLIMWPKYWSFSFSISPSNENSGLISFRMDWFDKNNIYVYNNVCSVMSDSLWPYGLRPPGSDVNGIFPARILEWVAIYSCTELSQHRDQTHVYPCLLH